MSNTLKIIIGCIAILVVLSTGIYFLNKELPGCFTPNVLSKIKTDVGCFELVKHNSKISNTDQQKEYLSQKTDSELNNFIEAAAKDYYTKVSPKIKDDNLKVIVNINFSGLGSNGYKVIYFYIDSPKLDNLNPVDYTESKIKEVNQNFDSNLSFSKINQPIFRPFKNGIGYFEVSYDYNKDDTTNNFTKPCYIIRYYHIGAKCTDNLNEMFTGEQYQNLKLN